MGWIEAIFAGFMLIGIPAMALGWVFGFHFGVEAERERQTRRARSLAAHLWRLWGERDDAEHWKETWYAVLSKEGEKYAALERKFDRYWEACRKIDATLSTLWATGQESVTEIYPEWDGCCEECEG